MNSVNSAKLSIVITSFNKGSYLAECLDSVIEGLNQGAEIIIVDDGSTDTSLEILRPYANCYPRLKYILQRNRGVSAARNQGIKAANGHYIIFLDADDRMDLEGLMHLYELCKKEDADTAIGSIIRFNEEELQETIPYLKRMFSMNNKQIIRHISKNPELNLSPSVCNKLFKRSLLLKHQIFFDESMMLGEDLLFSQRALYLSRNTLVKEIIVLHYRRFQDEITLSRVNETSLFDRLIVLQMKIKLLYEDLNVSHLLSTIELRQFKYFLNSIFEMKKPTIQRDPHHLFILTETFIQVLKFGMQMNELKLEEQLLVKIILNKDISSLEKLFIVMQDNKFETAYIAHEGAYYHPLYTYFQSYESILKIWKHKLIHRVEIVKQDDMKIYIGGYAFIHHIPADAYKRYLVIRNNEVQKRIPLTTALRTDVTFLHAENRVDYNEAGFETLEINVKDLGYGEWDFFIGVQMHDQWIESPVYIPLSQLRNSLKPVIANEFLISPKYKMGSFLCLEIQRVNKWTNIRQLINGFKKDFRYDISFLKKRDFHTFFSIALIKLLGRLLRGQRIWLIGERRDTAQDNSFHLFSYIRKYKKEINIYYVIDKRSKDYQKIKEFGNIIHFGSLKHTLYLLACTMTLNSYIESANMYTAAYKNILKYYPHWQKNKKVFLQHGVIGVSRVNHSLHKNRTGYSLFVTSSENERDHILSEFGYQDKEVVVTGLPRWDALEDVSQGNEILLMPTWRNWIKTGSQLKASNYFQTYMAFLKSKELHELLERRNLVMTFYPHYKVQQLLGDIPFIHERIRIVRQGQETVQQLLKSHRLLITDYSTVSYDFAYMNKQVLFYQFDYDEFFSRHYNKGIIEIESKQVCKNEAELINKIKESLENNVARYSIKNEHDISKKIILELSGL